MKQHLTQKGAAMAMALAAMGWAGTAQAASTDYLLKLDGVPGESKEGKKDFYKGWIELNSVQLAEESKASKDKDHKQWIDIASARAESDGAAPGGVRVASGDVNGDGTANATSGQATGRRTHEPIVIHKRIDKSTPAPAAANDRLAAPDNDATAALLVPAVQKVREAAARMPAWEGCAAGQKIESIAIKQKTTGRMGRILDATVSRCASEQVSFNFTKIEWD